MAKSIQDQMFEHFRDKNIFEQARHYAFDYLDTSLERHVFPAQVALDSLVHFDEKLPAEPSDARELLESLHRYGSPATVAQRTHRYT